MVGTTDRSRHRQIRDSAARGGGKTFGIDFAGEWFKGGLMRAVTTTFAIGLVFALFATAASAAPITVSGVWTGTDQCGVCSGFNTNELSNGTPIAGSVSNLFTFEGATADVELGEIFVLGTLSFRNGRVGGTPVPGYFDLLISTSSPVAAFDNQAIELRMHLVGTPNQLVDPFADADYVWFSSPAGEPQFGQSLRVFEDSPGSPSVGTVQLLGRINSLHYEGLGELLTPQTAFVTATSNPNDITPVPEPASLALVAAGVAVQALRRLRLRKRSDE